MGPQGATYNCYDQRINLLLLFINNISMGNDDLTVSRVGTIMPEYLIPASTVKSLHNYPSILPIGSVQIQKMIHTPKHYGTQMQSHVHVYAHNN